MPFKIWEDQREFLAKVLNEFRAEWDKEHAAEIAELRGKVDVLLTMVAAPKSRERMFDCAPGAPSDDDSVVDLPRGFIRRRTDDAA